MNTNHSGYTVRDGHGWECKAFCWGYPLGYRGGSATGQSDRMTDKNAQRDVTLNGARPRQPVYQKRGLHRGVLAMRDLDEVSRS
jgi:hypothetical protein